MEWKYIEGSRKHTEDTRSKNLWILEADQGTDEWKRARIGRCTGSKVGVVAGHSKFETPEEYAPICAGTKVKEFSEDQLANMRHGTLNEPNAREWYEKTTGYAVYEIGLASPEFDPSISYSPDGLVDDDGMIEIKCPVRGMYVSLKRFMQEGSIMSGTGYQRYKHIFQSHYDQMQYGMFILGRKWCDYIAYSVTDGVVFKQRVPYNHEYSELLYQHVKSFQEEYIRPLLPNGPPIMPVL